VATALLLTSVFDREVNCRRAAAAAYQECVGRLGARLFPRGLAVIALTDMLTLASVERCYAGVAAAVCRADDSLVGAFVRCVVEQRSKHWDVAVRALAARALASLLPLCNAQLAEWVVAALRPRRDAGALALHAVVRDAATLAALASEAAPYKARATPEWLDVVAAAFESGAVNADARARLDAVVLGCLGGNGKDDAGAERAAHALAAALVHAPLDSDGALAVRLCGEAGGARALACIPAAVLAQNRAAICAALDASCAAVACAPEHRRDAVTALAMAAAPPLDAAAVASAVRACLRACDDYRSDERGDVGSWSRAAALRTLDALADALGWTLVDVASPGACALAMRRAARLACERIDAVREPAVALLRRGGALADGVADGGSDLKAVADALLLHDALRGCAAVGLAQSAGGVMEAARRAGEAALIGFAAECDDAALASVLDSLLWAIRTSPGVERVQTPTLRALAFVLETCGGAQRAPALFCRMLAAVVARDAIKTKSPQRLVAAGRLLVVLGEAGHARMDALEPLLGHAFPTVRTGVADACFVWLMAADGDAAGAAVGVLAETRWEDVDAAATGVARWRTVWSSAAC